MPVITRRWRPPQFWLLWPGARMRRMATRLPGTPFAREACRACHMVEARQQKPRRIVIGPAFRDIANTRGMTATALRVFLTTSHPKMPNLIPAGRIAMRTRVMKGAIRRVGWIGSKASRYSCASSKAGAFRRSLASLGQGSRRSANRLPRSKNISVPSFLCAPPAVSV